MTPVLPYRRAPDRERMMKSIFFAALAVVFLIPAAHAQFSGPGNAPSVGDYIGRQQAIDQSQQYRNPYQSPGPGNLPYSGYPSVSPAYPSPAPDQAGQSPYNYGR